MIFFPRLSTLVERAVLNASSVRIALKRGSSVVRVCLREGLRKRGSEKTRVKRGSDGLDMVLGQVNANDDVLPFQAIKKRNGACPL